MSTDLVKIDKRDVAGPERVNELHALVIEEWSAMDAFIEGTRKKAQARRIRLGYRLLELKQLIDAGENGELCTFWEWFDDMVPGRSRSDARDLMHTARQADPDAAYQQKLGKQKEYTERHYRKKLGAPASESGSDLIRSPEEPEPELLPPVPKPKPRYPSAEGDDDWIEVIINAFRQLSWNGRVRVMKRLHQLFNRWRKGES